MVDTYIVKGDRGRQGDTRIHTHRQTRDNTQPRETDPMVNITQRIKELMIITQRDTESEMLINEDIKERLSLYIHDR